MQTLNSILEWLGNSLSVPNLLLVSLMVLAFWILQKAQQRKSFEIGDMLLDESGKPSSARFAVMISLGLTSYLLSYVVINKRVDDDTIFYMFLAYTITWASSKSLEKAIDAWSNRGNDRPRSYSGRSRREDDEEELYQDRAQPREDLTVQITRSDENSDQPRRTRERTRPTFRDRS
jgi:hypothetical protein